MEAAQSAVQPAASQRLAHLGDGGELFAINLVNLLLKVVTLGIYHFWGKTRVRRYVWSHTSFAGERFEYVGRGIELLRGYIIAMVVLSPLLAVWYLPQFAPREVLAKYGVLLGLLSSLASLLFLFLIGFARYSSRRYLLSRTRWRGIRFGMSGSAKSHGWKMLGYSLLSGINLGIYTPFMRSNLMANLLDHTWFGDQRMTYSGRGGELFPRFLGAIGLGLLVAVAAGILIAAIFGGLMPFIFQGQGEAPNPFALLAPILIGLVFYLSFVVVVWWYRAGELRYFVGHTALADVRFSCDFSTAGYIWLWVSNTLLLTFTMGLAYAWVVVRTARFLIAHLHLEGELDLAAIEQTSQQVPTAGEGLAEALDLGSI
jgi:uncharacterized membrane protein YjgN (DUF898 family)